MKGIFPQPARHTRRGPAQNTPGITHRPRMSNGRPGTMLEVCACPTFESLWQTRVFVLRAGHCPRDNGLLRRAGYKRARQRQLDMFTITPRGQRQIQDRLCHQGHAPAEVRPVATAGRSQPKLGYSFSAQGPKPGAATPIFDGISSTCANRRRHRRHRTLCTASCYQSKPFTQIDWRGMPTQSCAIRAGISTSPDSQHGARSPSSSVLAQR